MNFGSIGRLVATGLATFLLVTVTVTELLQSRIEFSLLVGIPAGLVAGAVAGGVVAWGFADGAPERRRRIASSFGAFAMTVLVTIVAGLLLPIRIALTIVVGTVVGLMTAVGSTAATAAALVPAERDSRVLRRRDTQFGSENERSDRAESVADFGERDHRSGAVRTTERSATAITSNRHALQSVSVPAATPYRRPKTRVLVSSISTIPPSGVVPSVNSATPANSGDIAVSRRGTSPRAAMSSAAGYSTSVRRPVPFGARQ